MKALQDYLRQNQAICFAFYLVVVHVDLWTFMIGISRLLLTNQFIKIISIGAY